MARQHVAAGALQALFADWRIDPMRLWVAYPANRHLSRKVRVFIDWIVEVMAREVPT
jgi:DNA-binding transcriptional LysR family regulator